MFLRKIRKKSVNNNDLFCDDNLEKNEEATNSNDETREEKFAFTPLSPDAEESNPDSELLFPHLEEFDPEYGDKPLRNLEDLSGNLIEIPDLDESLTKLEKPASLDDLTLIIPEHSPMNFVTRSYPPEMLIRKPKPGSEPPLPKCVDDCCKDRQLIECVLPAKDTESPPISPSGKSPDQGSCSRSRPRKKYEFYGKSSPRPPNIELPNPYFLDPLSSPDSLDNNVGDGLLSPTTIDTLTKLTDTFKQQREELLDAIENYAALAGHAPYENFFEPGLFSEQFEDDSTHVYNLGNPVNYFDMHKTNLEEPVYGNLLQNLSQRCADDEIEPDNNDCPQDDRIKSNYQTCIQDGRIKSNYKTCIEEDQIELDYKACLPDDQIKSNYKTCIQDGRINSNYKTCVQDGRINSNFKACLQDDKIKPDYSDLLQEDPVKFDFNTCIQDGQIKSNHKTRFELLSTPLSIDVGDSTPFVSDKKDINPLIPNLQNIHLDSDNTKSRNGQEDRNKQTE